VYKMKTDMTDKQFSRKIPKDFIIKF